MYKLHLHYLPASSEDGEGLKRSWMCANTHRKHVLTYMTNQHFTSLHMITIELVTNTHILCVSPTRMWAPPFLWAMVPVQKHSPRLARGIFHIFQKGGFKNVEAENEAQAPHSHCLGQSVFKSPIWRFRFFFQLFVVVEIRTNNSVWKILMDDCCDCKCLMVNWRFWGLQFLGSFEEEFLFCISLGFPSCTLSDPRNLSEAIWCQKNHLQRPVVAMFPLDLLEAKGMASASTRRTWRRFVEKNWTLQGLHWISIH